MANIRQYIGARYVFKIYENSQDSSSAEWEPNVTYEPLTIVTYLNSTYASKKDVPGSVGNPAANPQYWVVTGAYNGQIATLQQQIDTINNTTIPSVNAAIQALSDQTTASIQNLSDQTAASIQNLSNRIDQISPYKILFVGDSFNTIYPNEGWDKTMAALLGTDDYISINIAGLGFCTSPTWTEALTNRLSLISDKDEFSAVIVCGGANDRPYSLTQITNGMASFKNVVDSNFPNAKMYVGFIGWSGLSTQHGNFRSCRDNYILAAQANGINYLHNVEYTLHWKPYLRDNTAENPQDYIHPTSAGLVALGQKICDAYLMGVCHVKYSSNMTFTADGTNVSNIAGDSMNVTMADGFTYVTLGEQAFTYAAQATAFSGKVIGNLTCDCFNPAQLTITLDHVGMTSHNIVPVKMVFYNNGVIATAPYKDLAAEVNRSVAQVFTFDSMAC